MQSGFGINLPETLEELCDPQSMALLVYDMQVGILHQIANAEQIVANAQRALTAARESGMRVFFCRHMTLPNEVSGAVQLRMRMAWQRLNDVNQVKSVFPRDSAQFQIAPEVAPLASEAVFEKITMSAFEGTPLNIALRDCGINAITVVGVALEVGIEPTVRHAADLGYIPVLLTDACGYGHQKAAERSIESLKYAGDAILTDVDSFASALQRRSKSQQVA